MKLVATVALVALLAGSTGTPSREQAAAFQRKLDEITQHGERPTRSPRQTTVTEDEVNSYLRFSAGDRLPVGVTEPSITAHLQGRLSGRAVVDLDLVRRTKSSGGWFDPLSYLTGRLPLTASGTLQTHEGRGRFTLESATLAGIPLPRAFLHEIVSHYTRTDDYPNGINIDDPFDLPASIQRIDVQQGRAVVTQ